MSIDRLTKNAEAARAAVCEANKFAEEFAEYDSAKNDYLTALDAARAAAEAAWQADISVGHAVFMAKRAAAVEAEKTATASAAFDRLKAAERALDEARVSQAYETEPPFSLSRHP